MMLKMNLATIDVIQKKRVHHLGNYAAYGSEPSDNQSKKAKNPFKKPKK